MLAYPRVRNTPGSFDNTLTILHVWGIHTGIAYCARGLRTIGYSRGERSLTLNCRLGAAQSVESILAGYMEDVVIRFADVPELRGKGAAEKRPSMPGTPRQVPALR
jgi:hypothetical protein